MSAYLAGIARAAAGVSSRGLSPGSGVGPASPAAVGKAEEVPLRTLLSLVVDSNRFCLKSAVKVP